MAADLRDAMTAIDGSRNGGRQLPLDGRTALVTGASSGIGAETARRLAGAGARVCVAARRVGRLDELVRGLPNDAIALPVDLSEPDAGTSLAERALDHMGRVDILVNNAATIDSARSERLTGSQIAAILRVNIQAPLELAASLARSMLSVGHGSIINISSLVGSVGVPFQAAYDASKGAIDAATRALACEWGPFGIRVNCVAPGMVETEMWGVAEAAQGVKSTMKSRTPMRRIGLPGEIADVVVFLASDAASFVTGQVITVDGGLSTALDFREG